MKKAIIFDWSGTLFDNFDRFYDVCRYMFNELNGTLPSKQEIRENHTTPYMDFWNKYFPNLTKEKQDHLFLSYWSSDESYSLFEGIIDLLSYLSTEGYGLFILSSDPAKSLLDDVGKSSLKPLFLDIVGGVHDKPLALKNLIETHSLPVQTTLYIGDTSGDVAAGKSACVKTVGVTYGWQPGKVLSKSNPDYIAHDVLTLEKLLLSF